MTRQVTITKIFHNTLTSNAKPALKSVTLAVADISAGNRSFFLVKENVEFIRNLVLRCIDE